MHNIGERIRSLRKEKGLTQDALAAQLHVTRQTVSNYENGKSEPDLDTLMHIAEVLETDVNGLLNLPPETTVPQQAKQWTKAATILVLSVLCLWGLHVLKELAYEYAKIHYIAVYSYAIILICYPIAISFLGYAVMFTLQQFASFPAAKVWYPKAHKFLWILLVINLVIYLPQLIWCLSELLRLAGLSIPKLTAWDHLWPYWHMMALLRYPQICYTLYGLCGAGIAITNKKSAEG